MTSIHYITQEQRQRLAKDYATSFQSADPFPYVVIDNFMNPDALRKVLEVFPSPKDLAFYKYENPLEKKLAMDQLSKLPIPIQQILLYLNSPDMLLFFEQLTGIEGLIPDPYYRGGGIHQIETGGKLDVHIDFNRHPKLQLERRLNAIIYLNEDWDESYGGHLDIWRGHTENGRHVLDECVQKILPVFNRMVVFATSERSYHGHPDPVTCPVDRTRKSIALYYYTNGRPKDEMTDPHSTTFIKRPTDADSPELDDMRDARNKGRLHSNQKTKLV
ncbi:MAG: 2OG-Fe(II) oxygenase [Candidatus Marinamargulisbacteria bacterium]